jgi:hypothetical protein
MRFCANSTVFILMPTGGGKVSLYVMLTRQLLTLQISCCLLGGKTKSPLCHLATHLPDDQSDAAPYQLISWPLLILAK